MYKFCGSVLTKVLAWFFLYLSLALMVFSAVGVFVLYGNDAYFDNGSALRVNAYEDVCSRGAEQVLHYQMALDGYYSDSDIRITSFAQSLSPENSNLRWRVSDSSGKELNSTFDDTPIREVWETDYIHAPKKSVSMQFPTYAEGVAFLDNFKVEQAAKDKNFLFVSSESFYSESEDAYHFFVEYYSTDFEYHLSVAVIEDLTHFDLVAIELTTIDWLTKNAYVLIAILVISALLFLADTILLLCCAGRRKGTETVHLGWVARIPWDLLCALLFLIPCLVIDRDRIVEMVSFGAAILLAVPLLYSFAARLKQRGWWKNSVLFYCVKLCFRAMRFFLSLIEKIPLFPVTIILLVCLPVFELLCLSFASSGGVFLWLVEKFIFSALIIKVVLDLRHLEKGGSEIASGNVSYKVTLRSVLPVFRRHATDLNNLSDGLDRALAERMKSERMKAELITNVSHDIKTPLTSIINYVDLLKREGVATENAPEYLAALDRQSQRLKKLTEDLIEASKASSGSLTVNAERTNFTVLLEQSIGEYTDKLEKMGITVVFDRGADTYVMTDGRLLWRVFDNLLSNIVKYAQPNTRAYFSMAAVENRVSAVFRNVSKDALNITPEELTERFVRGDASRNTEGSGLGLSIAKDITELIGGTFRLEIDGDLFKAVVSFPMLPPAPEQP